MATTKHFAGGITNARVVICSTPVTVGPAGNHFQPANRPANAGYVTPAARGNRPGWKF